MRRAVVREGKLVLQVSMALEVSRSGVGAHAWMFFTSPVPAGTARRFGIGLLREAMTLRGRINLASYDRPFSSLDLLPADGLSFCLHVGQVDDRHGEPVSHGGAVGSSGVSRLPSGKSLGQPSLHAR